MRSTVATPTLKESTAKCGAVQLAPVVQLMILQGKTCRSGWRRAAPDSGTTEDSCLHLHSPPTLHLPRCRIWASRTPQETENTPDPLRPATRAFHPGQHHPGHCEQPGQAQNAGQRAERRPRYAARSRQAARPPRTTGAQTLMDQLSRGRRSSRIASMRASAARLSWTWSLTAPIPE